MPVRPWIDAFRLHTLPLALGGLVMGNLLGGAKGDFDWGIAVFSVLTALLLQILSNLANDYGDTVHGADSEKRVGPQRAVQSGAITAGQMKMAVGFLAALSLLSGIVLLYLSFEHIGLVKVLMLFGIGILAVIAAIAYTATDRPYGYAGFGDLSVFIFFGLVAVVGSYFLQTGTLGWRIFLPAAAYGFLSTGVLNVNNMRDIDSDGEAGKRSIPVRIGLWNAKRYHAVLILWAWVLLVVFSVSLPTVWWNWLYLPLMLLFIPHLRSVMTAQEPEELAPQLKNLALSSALLAIVFGVCQLL